jgi:ParB family transcriptional regulator, chromosome partitioning protein
MSADTPRRLGRGLEALISTAKQQRETSASASTEGPPARSSPDLQTIRIAEITPNHFQPRRTFTEPELAELEASIRTNGLLQPIVVRRRNGTSWELVAGERRLRAATRLGWKEIPAVVRDFDDRAMLTLALVENLQRADLNPLEEADGYQRLITEFGLTQQQVADAVGKDRTTITNLLRVLTLPDEVRRLVEQGLITAGHARALLPIKDPRGQAELANQILTKHLSVRDTEALAREWGHHKDTNTASTRQKGPYLKSQATPDPAVHRIEEILRKRLQTDVHVQSLGDDRGTLRISFFGADDLERLLDLIIGSDRSDFD